MTSDEIESISIETLVGLRAGSGGTGAKQRGNNTASPQLEFFDRLLGIETTPSLEERLGWVCEANTVPSRTKRHKGANDCPDRSRLVRPKDGRQPMGRDTPAETDRRSASEQPGAARWPKSSTGGQATQFSLGLTILEIEAARPK